MQSQKKSMKQTTTRLVLFFICCITILSFINCSDQDWDTYDKHSTHTFAKRKVKSTEGYEPDVMYDTITYTFPDISLILTNDNVKSAMQTAWRKTLDAANEDGSRCEYGFYVYYDHISHEITCDEPLAGPIFPKDVRCTLYLPPTNRGLEICAFFHTHTPYKFCSKHVSRDTGESTEDLAAANERHWPGILYDFDTCKVGEGHSLEIPPRTITFGPPQRPDTIIIDTIPL